MRRLALALGVAALAVPAGPAIAGGGCHGSSLAAATGPLRVQAVRCAFDPASIRIRPGATVTWTNLDRAPHTVTSAGRGALFNGVIEHGQSFSFTFERSGTYEYFCAYHPGMAGTVVVGEGTPSSVTTSGLAASPVAARREAQGTSAGALALAAALGALAGGAGVALTGRARRRGATNA